MATCLAAMLGLLFATPVQSATLDGTLTLGNVSLDEDTGDKSAMQETFNIHDGFTVSQILLHGQFSGRNFFQLDLREINQDSRKGLFRYRVADLGDVTVRFDQSQQVFDTDGAVRSERKNWQVDAKAAPTSWLRFNADYGRQARDGDRLTYPVGTTGWLGTGYDYTLQTGHVEAEVHDQVRGVAVGYDVSDYADDLHMGADRQGHIFSVRAYTPCALFPNHVTHFVRAAVGRQKLVGSDLQYKLSSFQYDGIVKPIDDIRFKYDLYLSRVDDEVTALKTDDIRNNFDLTYHLKYGEVFGGYSYVTNDDDQTLTSSNIWRVGAAGGYHKAIRARVSYASSDLTDKERVTLLQDSEQDHLRASIQSQPIDALTIGAKFADRKREFPLIGVDATGWMYSAFGRLNITNWGSIGADYTYTLDKYVDREGRFDASSNVVTGRVNVDYIKNLHLAAAVSYLDIGKDLDIEKSILSFEGRYDLLDDYHVDVKYNVYNYDDYILLDRYYTANVVWVNIGYDFSLE